MADKEFSSTPGAKTQITSSSNEDERNAVSQTQTGGNKTAAVTGDVVAVDDGLEAIEEVEADDGDSAFGAGDQSDTTSVASSIYAGYIENGRRYQTLREGEYYGPSDEQQFESMNAVHLVYWILDSKSKNPLFQSPIPEHAQNIIDIGTGSGIWAKDVADRWPSATVRGVDLYPPPDNWVPPNCVLEVDDVLKPWMNNQNYDLVHMRMLAGSFSDEQWRLLYKQAYKNLQSGGYIEQVEASPTLYCDDATLPFDSAMAKWGPMVHNAAAKPGRPMDTRDIMRARIEAAGFTNIQEKTYKVPLGDWAKDPVLKEAGKFNMSHFKEGMEGYAMFLLTKFGDPEPWSPKEVQVFLAQMRKELDKGYHTYFKVRRVWAQKPLDTDKTEQKVEVENAE